MLEMRKYVGGRVLQIDGPDASGRGVGVGVAWCVDLDAARVACTDTLVKILVEAHCVAP